MSRIGVLFVGLNGTTANTTVVGTKAIQKGIVSKDAAQRGMLTTNYPFDSIDLIDLRDMIFGGWDLEEKNAYQAAIDNEVLQPRLVEDLKDDIQSIHPMAGVLTSHDPDWNRAKYIKEFSNFDDALKKLILDIASFKETTGAEKCVVVHVGSAQRYLTLGTTHQTLNRLEQAICDNSYDVTSGILYALAAIKSGCPFVDFTANRTLEVHGLMEAAEKYGVPVAGKDGNTGQTLMKSIIAHMLKVRNMKLVGWYSTNILGDNDGRVLSIPDFAKAKIEDKLSVLKPILGYDNFSHIVDIKYYPPRKDNKEAWDNVDFMGWLDQMMSLKIDWLGKDSILAAPLVLDLIRLMEFSLRRRYFGLQSQLAIYFKHPLGTMERAFFKQYDLLVSFYEGVSRGRLSTYQMQGGKK